MKKALWITLAVLLAAAIAAGIFLWVRTRAPEEDPAIGNAEAEFPYVAEELNEGLRVTIKGIFVKDAWDVNCSEPDVIQTETLESEIGKAVYLVKGTGFTGPATLQFILNSVRNKTDGYCISMNVYLHTDGRVTVTDYVDMTANKAHFEGSTDQYTYNLDILQNSAVLTLASSQYYAWNMGIENDSFLTITEQADDQQLHMIDLGADAVPVEQTWEESIIPPADYDETQDLEDDDDAVPAATDDDHMAAAQDAGNAASAEEGGNLDGKTGTEDKKYVRTYTISASGYGEKQLLRLCAEELTTALEISFGADVNGALTASDIQTVPFAFEEVDPVLQGVIDSILFAGNDSILQDYETTNAEIMTDKDKNGNSYSYAVSNIVMDGTLMSYLVSPETTAMELATAYIGDGAFESVSFEGIEMQITMSNSGFAILCSHGENACVLGHWYNYVKIDGKEVLETLDRETVYGFAKNLAKSLKNSETETKIE